MYILEQRIKRSLVFLEGLDMPTSEQPPVFRRAYSGDQMRTFSGTDEPLDYLRAFLTKR